MSQSSISFPFLCKQDNLFPKYIYVKFLCICDNKYYGTHNEPKLKLSEVILPQLNPNTSTFITLEAEKEPAYPAILLDPYLFTLLRVVQSSVAKIIVSLKLPLLNCYYHGTGCQEGKKGRNPVMHSNTKVPKLQ